MNCAMELRTVSLRDIEESKRGLDYEAGTLLSASGVVLKEYTGMAHTVSPPPEDKQLFKGNIFTHNHPGGKCFTCEDIARFIDYKLHEVRVSTPQGTYYSLKEGLGEINRSIANVMELEEVGSAIKASDYILSQGFDYSANEYQAKLFDIMSDDVDNWLTDNAIDFGYIYTKGEI